MCYLFIYILCTAAIVKITTFNVRQPQVVTVTLNRQSVRGDIAVMQINLPVNHTVVWGAYEKYVVGKDVMYYISNDGIIPSPSVKPHVDWDPTITVLRY